MVAVATALLVAQVALAQSLHIEAPTIHIKPPTIKTPTIKTPTINTTKPPTITTPAPGVGTTNPNVVGVGRGSTTSGGISTHGTTVQTPGIPTISDVQRGSGSLFPPISCPPGMTARDGKCALSSTVTFPVIEGGAGANLQLSQSWRPQACTSPDGCPCGDGYTVVAGNYCPSVLTCIGGSIEGGTCQCPPASTGPNVSQVAVNGVCTPGGQVSSSCEDGGYVDSAGNCDCPNSNVNPTSGSCLQPPTQILCEGGTILGGFCICPNGDFDPLNGSCTSSQPASLICINGYTTGGTCQCGPGETAENGLCTAGAQPPSVCEGGQFDGAGNCDCPNGNVNPTGGNCLQPPVQIACNGGSMFPDGNCVCPGDTAINPASGSCTSSQPAPLICIGGLTFRNECLCFTSGPAENGVCTVFANQPQPSTCFDGNFDGLGNCDCPNGNVNPTGGNCLLPPPQIACNGGSIGNGGNCFCPDGQENPASGTCANYQPPTASSAEDKPRNSSTPKIGAITDVTAPLAEAMASQQATSNEGGAAGGGVPPSPDTGNASMSSSQPANSGPQAPPIRFVHGRPVYANSFGPQYPQGVTYNNTFASGHAIGTVTIDGVTLQDGPETAQLVREAETPPPKMWLNGRLVPITAANKAAAQKAFWNSYCGGPCTWQGTASSTTVNPRH